MVFNGLYPQRRKVPMHHTPNEKFNSECSTTSIPFLDVNIQVHDGKMETDLLQTYRQTPTITSLLQPPISHKEVYSLSLLFTWTATAHGQFLCNPIISIRMLLGNKLPRMLLRHKNRSPEYNRYRVMKPLKRKKTDREPTDRVPFTITITCNPSTFSTYSTRNNPFYTPPNV